ncbi:Lrp/AsnC family transcriptional regulator [Desulfosediminicola flagellatus]|uniref:Lrp/AsnC family transcriptional regulator n=1 Tax=Desulfosediminicola flagellatus TaxID=2569541 RepID=UPI0010ACFE3C|nr:Lrp/AsnC family transcriptional regulator [Desulfosediminicola flagellatus]
MSKKDRIDNTDRQIIELLQKDGRLSNTFIGKKLGISEATVRNRLNRLINEDYIQIVAVSNPLKLGYEAVGILKISTDIKKIDLVIEALQDIKPVWFVVQTTGESDIHAEFVAPSIEALNSLIFEQIYKIDGVLSAETSLILNYLKREYDWGVANDS